jgi:hypothetical protein
MSMTPLAPMPDSPAVAHPDQPSLTAARGQANERVGFGMRDYHQTIKLERQALTEIKPNCQM